MKRFVPLYLQGAPVARGSASLPRSYRLGGARVFASAAVPAVKSQTYQPPKEIHGFELVRVRFPSQGVGGLHPAQPPPP